MHIEGKAGLDGRSVQESIDEDVLKEAVGSVKKGTGSKKGTEFNKTLSHMGDPNEDEGKSVVSGGEKSGSANKSKTEMNVSMENFKFDIPESCHVGMMKKAHIQRLEAKYLLVTNPLPQVEG